MHFSLDHHSLASMELQQSHADACGCRQEGRAAAFGKKCSDRLWPENLKRPLQSLKVRAACVCRAGADHDLRAACSRPLLLRAGEKCWIRAWNRNNPVVAWYRCQQVALSRAFLLFFFFLRFSCSKILDRKEEGKVLYWLLAD